MRSICMSLLRLGCLALLVLLSGGCALRGAALRRFEFRQLHMGVETRITLYAPDAATAAQAARSAFGRIAVLDSLLSDYRPDSELTRLSARAGGPPVRVSEELFSVLSRARELARLSGDAFDVTAGPLVRLWRGARRSGVLPTPAERAEALARTGWRHLRLDSASRTARLAVPGMQLDLGGIAKGYAADEGISTLRAHGVHRALIEMGGDVVAGGPPPGTRGWRVRVADARGAPRALRLAHAAVSTSGDTEQFVEIGGVRYSHVVDPATGVGLTTRAAATVVAADGITADALSTLLTVLGPERGPAFLAAHFPGVRGWVRTAGGGAPARSAPGAEQAAHEAGELADAERLLQEAIGPRTPPVHVALVGRAEERHRDVPESLVHLERAAGVAPVQVGHHHVQQHQVGPLGAGQHQRLRASVRLQHLEASVGEHLGDQRRDGLLVVRDQHAGSGIHLSLPQRGIPSPVSTISEPVNAFPTLRPLSVMWSSRSARSCARERTLRMAMRRLISPFCST
jgi:thiamine biosynthesis lipoprotein